MTWNVPLGAVTLVSVASRIVCGGVVLELLVEFGAQDTSSSPRRSGNVQLGVAVAVTPKMSITCTSVRFGNTAPCWS